MNEEHKNIQTAEKVDLNSSLNSLNEYEKPKKSHTGGIIIAILILIIIGLVGYIVYSNGYLDKYLNKEEKQEEKQNAEKELTDNKAIVDLQKQQDVINLLGASSISPAPSYYKNVESKNIPEGEKLRTVIAYLDQEKKYTIEDPAKYPNVKGDGIMMNGNTLGEDEIDLEEFYYDEYEEGYHIIKASDVRELYKKVYGEELKETTAFNTYPWYYYEKGYDIYLMVSKGGGTCGEYYQQYNYKYTEDNDYAYIYTSLAYFSCEPDIYKDFEMREAIAKLSMDNPVPEDFVQKNLDKLNKYRVVFKKDNGNFIFEKIEEVKE